MDKLRSISFVIMIASLDPVSLEWQQTDVPSSQHSITKSLFLTFSFITNWLALPKQLLPLPHITQH